MQPLFTPLHTDTTAISADIIEQAATWMVRLQASEYSENEQHQHGEWLSANSLHLIAWQRMQGLAQDIQAGPHLTSAPIARQALLSTDGKQRRMVLKSIAGISMAGTSGLLAWHQLPWSSWMADHRTATGEQRQIMLADGTALMMNTDSALDVAFSEQERRITLHHGEILVTTAKDQRPLKIVTSNGTIAPVGTRFTVRHEDIKPTRVMVTEGAVRLQPRNSSNSKILDAGMQAVFTSQESTLPTPLTNADMAWTSGMLVVERVKLSAFIEELNRYHRGKLSCADDAANLLMSGAYAVQDIQAVITLLQETLPLRTHYVTRYWITLHHL
ncbi:FecR family protein [Methylobacillus gramineus]|uniref:FecR family protein n=1 Tax=Methylobacillus gramineus TaxID=755169 RepID=UPI001CFFCE83|nr:FecR family protein [Methylobacillus gramineus]MCB5184633.1 FecR family protein [Methylobacillus gramineus]